MLNISVAHAALTACASQRAFGAEPSFEGRRSLIGPMLPAGVALEERFEDPTGVETDPEEAAVVANAVEERQREFTTARFCAHLALARLGVPPAPILPLGDSGPPWGRGAPRWPAGIVGSMTHCWGFRAAAVALRADVASVGIDAEPHLALADGVEAIVALPEERDGLARLRAGRPDIAWGRVLFSAKESVYKAWFSLTGRWLNFDQCRVSLSPETGNFAAVLAVPGPIVAGRHIDGFVGKWRVAATGAEVGHVATAVLVLPFATSGWW